MTQANEPVDPTEEMKAIRDKLAAEANNDIAAIGENLRRRQASSGRQYVTLPKRDIRSTAVKSKAG